MLDEYVIPRSDVKYTYQPTEATETDSAPNSSTWTSIDSTVSTGYSFSDSRRLSGSSISTVSTFLPTYSITSPFSTQTTELPTYSTVFHEPETPSRSAFEHHRDTVHQFHMPTSKGKPWAIVRLKSNARSHTDAPHYFAGNHVSGVFALHLAEPTQLRDITLTIRGQIITGEYCNDVSAYTFLNELITIWSKNWGDPGGSPFSSSTKFSGRLSGDYSWPFDLPFPTGLSHRVGNASTATLIRLPDIFREASCNGSVRYQLIFRVNRGKMQANSKLQVPVLYTPRVTPEPMSLLRQMAYENSLPLARPDSDPAGWRTLPPVISTGRLLDGSSGTLHCTLSLPLPLVYTRGSVAPFYLRMHSTDIRIFRALDLPKAINLILRRRITYLEPRIGVKKRLQDCTETSIIDVSKALWWSPDSPDDPLRRIFEGELHIHKQLPAASDYELFSIEYTVELLPFRSPGFVPFNKESLLSQVVEVATEFADGPIPKALTTAPKPEFLYRMPNADAFVLLNSPDTGGLSMPQR
ncbi:hypothetical protein IW261DRAFT_1473795 [Armillaria novae-zelandiae]|uniref:Arrestin-like N-terminal domain-containing protein n=1 Tax=Armillaria novae-zelandiae TaxID=153914 RepID=A0AA39PC32_9AGAR|nr:hypothetical protein IW261DRAFT_1473795 [Armillaria novae-zelandiae]